MRDEEDGWAAEALGYKDGVSRVLKREHERREWENEKKKMA